MFSIENTKYKFFGLIFICYPVIATLLFPNLVFQGVTELFTGSNIGLPILPILPIFLALIFPVTYLSQIFLGIILLLYGYGELPTSTKHRRALIIGGVGLALAFLGILPLLLSTRDAFAAFFEIIFSFIFGPLTVIALCIAVFGSGSKKLKITFWAALALLVLTGFLAYLVYTPKSFSDCERLQGVTRREGCFHNIGIKEINPAYCERISSRPLKNLCYSGIVQKTGDANLCSKLSSHTDACYIVAARIKHDVSICEKIVNTELRNRCATRTSTRR